MREVSIEACRGAADFTAKLKEATQRPVRMAHSGGVNRFKVGANKTDFEDAWHLANLSRVEYLPEVWFADEATRQLRWLVRRRQGVVDLKKRIMLGIRALLREERTVAPQSLPRVRSINRFGLRTFKQLLSRVSVNSTEFNVTLVA